jgi:hypothetical protein
MLLGLPGGMQTIADLRERSEVAVKACHAIR